MRKDRRLLPIELPVQVLSRGRHAAVDSGSRRGISCTLAGIMATIVATMVLDGVQHGVAILTSMVPRRAE